MIANALVALLALAPVDSAPVDIAAALSVGAGMAAVAGNVVAIPTTVLAACACMSAYQKKEVCI